MFLSEVWATRTGPTPTSSSPSGATTGRTSACSTAGSTPRRSSPNGSIAHNGTFVVARDANYDLFAPAGGPNLGNQPLSALISANAGERVLLRFANLGFMEAAMTLAGIRMRVVGRDATNPRSDGSSATTRPNTLSSGPARAST